MSNSKSQSHDLNTVNPSNDIVAALLASAKAGVSINSSADARLGVTTSGSFRGLHNSAHISSALVDALVQQEIQRRSLVNMQSTLWNPNGDLLRTLLLQRAWSQQQPQPPHSSQQTALGLLSAQSLGLDRTPLTVGGILKRDVDSTNALLQLLQQQQQHQQRQLSQFLTPAVAPVIPEKRKGRTGSFPQKLYRMLSDLEKAEGGTDIAAFLPHGRAFAIYDSKEFVKTVMPNYFRMSHFSSFQRQLNLYMFQRITEGPNKGCYYHELFIKGHPELCNNIKRHKIKAEKSPSRVRDPFDLLRQKGSESTGCVPNEIYVNQGSHQAVTSNTSTAFLLQALAKRGVL